MVTKWISNRLPKRFDPKNLFQPAPEGVIEDIRPGLARWVTPHPEWKPEEDFLDESYRDVASVLHVAPDALVLVDPLVPHSLWPALDARIEAVGKPVVVLTTIHWHARSRDEVAKRYDAQLGGENLQGVRAIDAARQREVALFLEGARAVVLGDAVLGDQQGGLRISPWYKDDAERERTRLALRPLLDLPIAVVLPAHGNPVLEGGREALEKALNA
jgi:glyoxylase-like metal-dependent hydrolase (beta-lactamase superfamily II)